MKQGVRKTVFGVSAGMAAVFGFAYYESYFKWRGCFNELGRCLDGDSGVVHLEQSGGVWLSLAVLASGIALYQLRQLTR